MSLVNFIPSQLSVLSSPYVRRGFHPAGNQQWRAKTIESAITFSNGSVPAFTITAQKSFAPGMRGNNLNFGCVRVDGSRYVLFLFEDDNDKLDGTLSTAGQAAGATTAAGIVNKVNTSAMFSFVRATLHTNATNIDYTGHSAVNLANTDPLIGGRG
tara:strand:+ start:704 stop:1171 length:468 start_codon:yes stop_codon:yes gene_type:complete